MSAVVAFAQSDSAQISGFVRDPSGAAISGASVSVRNEATGLERNTQTNASGYYVVTSIPPGIYTITAAFAAFKRSVTTQLKLDPSIASTADVTLEPGAPTETVEVVAARTTLQTEGATVGKLLEGSQIENMMLNGRNPMFLALLKPGVRASASMAGLGFSFTPPGGIAVNGARSQDLFIAYDGAVAVRSRGNGTSIGTLDVDAIQEMQILTANYNAEYGRSAGGQLRIITRSGTREFHGTFYEYFRNEAMDANTWALNRNGQDRPANKFNQFGYNLSGPVIILRMWNRDRRFLFFLWSQEWLRLRQDVTSIITVPSLAMRRGDFSELLDPANPYFGRTRTVLDPATRTPFSGNVIPATRLSPNGVAFLRAYPEPTPGFLQGRNNFIQTRPSPKDQRKDTLSIDFIPSQEHAIWFRAQNSWLKSVGAFQGGTDRAVTDLVRPNRTASVHHVWTIGPRAVNEILVTASRDRVFLEIQREGGRYERSR